MAAGGGRGRDSRHRPLLLDHHLPQGSPDGRLAHGARRGSRAHGNPSVDTTAVKDVPAAEGYPLWGCGDHTLAAAAAVTAAVTVAAVVKGIHCTGGGGKRT